MPDFTHTLDDVANMLGVSARTVETWIASGELRAINVSRSRESRKPRLRITAADLELFVASRSTAPTAPQRAARKPRRVIPQYV